LIEPSITDVLLPIELDVWQTRARRGDIFIRNETCTGISMCMDGRKGSRWRGIAEALDWGESMDVVVEKLGIN
jgi:hypothetical protein